MQRIKASGVVSVMPPAQENSYDPGYFSNGNPATGELATMMTAEWCNAVQEEIVSVIEDAGIVLDINDCKQLLAALNKKYSVIMKGATSSKPGASGQVPAPAVGDQDKFLKGDGSWGAAYNGEQEAEWRKSSIGKIDYFVRGSLPPGWVACDGSLVLFEDYPEFKSAYDEGVFDGMLLEADASSEDKQAWAGKFVKNEQGTGLYTPRLSGLFLRNAGSMGKFNTPGLPELAGSFIVGWTNASIPTYAHDGCFYASTYQAAQLNQTGTTAVNNTFTLGMKASKANGIFGKSSTVMPSSADIIVGLYLGRLT